MEKGIFKKYYLLIHILEQICLFPVKKDFKTPCFCAYLRNVTSSVTFYGKFGIFDGEIISSRKIGKYSLKKRTRREGFSFHHCTVEK